MPFLLAQGTPDKPVVQTVAHKKDIVRSMKTEGSRARSTVSPAWARFMGGSLCWYRWSISG
jgi:hypothetical protein